MASLAERTETLLKHVEDWPLGVAMDYLLEAGFEVLTGVRIVGRDRVARLKIRVEAVVRALTTEPLAYVAIRKYRDGTRAFIWWIRTSGNWSDGLIVTLLPHRILLEVTWGWDKPHCYTLSEWCHASAAQFPERSLCDLFVLLWCIARCYAGD